MIATRSGTRQHISCRSMVYVLVLALSAAVSYAQGSGPITQKVAVEITTHLGDHQTFVEQDVISFFISLDQAAYLYVFYQDVSGKVYQLMPGKAQPEHYFTAGQYMPFPAQTSTFKFVVQAPFGEEQLWVFASEQGKFEFKGKDTAQGIRQIALSYSELADYIKSSSGQLYGNARLSVHTRGRKMHD